MKKRAFLAILTVMILSIFTLVILTSCDNVARSKVEDKPISLTLYGIKGPTTTDEAIRLVEEKLNFKTQAAKFNVKLVLRFYTEEEYLDHVFDAMDSYDTVKAARAAQNPKDQIVDGYIYSSDVYTQGIINKSLYFPPAAENQVDIFYITSYEDYMFFYENNKLRQIDENNLKSNMPAVANNYPQMLLDEIGLALDSGVCAIPALSEIGEYEYMLINKKLYDEYYGNETGGSDEILSKISSESFYLGTDDTITGYLLDVAIKNKNFSPIYNYPTTQYVYSAPGFNGFGVLNYTSTFSYNNVKLNTYSDIFLLPNLSTKSIFTPQIVSSSARGASAAQTVIINKYLPQLKAADAKYPIFSGEIHYDDLIKHDNNGNIVRDDDGNVVMKNDFGIAYVKGSIALPKYCENEYYAVLVSAPVLTTERVYDFMYAINSQSVNDLDRIMKMVNLLVSDKEAASLLAYGVEGIHYAVENGEVINRSEDYMNNPSYVGNKFLLYPEKSERGEIKLLAASDWALGKSQNKDAVRGPFLNFTFEPKYSTEIEENFMDNYRAELTYLKKYFGITEAQLKDYKANNPNLSVYTYVVNLIKNTSMKEKYAESKRYYDAEYKIIRDLSALVDEMNAAYTLIKNDASTTVTFNGKQITVTNLADGINALISNFNSSAQYSAFKKKYEFVNNASTNETVANTYHYYYYLTSLRGLDQLPLRPE